MYKVQFLSSAPCGRKDWAKLGKTYGPRLKARGRSGCMASLHRQPTGSEVQEPVATGGISIAMCVEVSTQEIPKPLETYG